MKRIVVLVIFVLILLNSNCSDSRYTLTGELQGLPDGTELELVPGATHKNEAPEIESSIKNNAFAFKGKYLESPRLYYLRVKNARGQYALLLENGNISVNGEAKLRTENDKQWVSFENVVVTGSKSHALYLQKKEYKILLDKEYKKIHEDNAQINQQIANARAEKNNAKLDSLNKLDAGVKFAQDERAFFQNVEYLSKKAIMDNKDSWWGPFIMLDIMGWFTQEQQSWFQEFSPEAKASYYGQILEKELFPKTFVGEDVPWFTVNNGETDVSFKSLSEKKEWVVIDFWASWCSPCRKEIPKLKELYEKFSPEGFEIISISIDDDESAWKNALEKEQMKWPNFLDKKKTIQALFNVRTIPATFLVDKTGKIIMENIRSDELNRKLEELKLSYPNF